MCESSYNKGDNMHENRIICGVATESELNELNMAIGRENINGYTAIGIASSTLTGDICVLLSKEKAL